jgi:molecular chaperone HscB
MIPVATQNFFELFQMAPNFAVDLGKLDTHYREIQIRVHPDKSASLGDTEKRLSLQWATLANEAYQTLKNPLDRARYLLRLQGVDTGEENNTAMPTEFLMEQIEWREGLEEAKTLGNLEALYRMSGRLRSEMDNLFETLGNLIDIKKHYAEAVILVRQLAFLEKLDRDINQAQAELED